MEEEIGNESSVNIDDLNEDQMRMMLRMLNQSHSIESYFKWDNGLVHKLGVLKIKDQKNPSLPIVRSDGMILFENCDFDDFTMVFPGARVDNRCRFRSWKGFEVDKGDNHHLFPYGIDCRVPLTLWDVPDEEKADVEFFKYSWNNYLILPSNGNRFFPKQELHPEMRSVSSGFQHLYYAACNTESMCGHFEEIWIFKLRSELPEVFIELCQSLTEEHLRRCLGLAGIGRGEYETYIRVKSTIF